jgi:hypothetical protein
LAIAYAKRYKDNYSAIFWLNIKDEDSLKQSFARVARQISQEYPLASRLSSADVKGDLDEVINAIKAWLSLPYDTRWLMIYDNYDNPKLTKNTDLAAINIRQFLPESYQGSVIITTRSSEVKIGHCIQVTKLGNIQDSLKILSNTSNRERIENVGVIYICKCSSNSSVDSDAIKLAKKLDGFPLALATAGAYLNQAATSFSAYLRLYEESWGKL